MTNYLVMQNNISQTLLEVRKAYRFLYSYQKRILDLISFIGGKFGFKYNGGYPKFSSPAPRNGKGYLNLWSWDWLNLYYYEFHFENFIIQEDQIYFSIFLLNDTGYFESRQDNNIAKTSVGKFKLVEDSKSELIFVIGKNMWDGWGYDWDEPEFILQSYGEKVKETIN